EHRDDLGGLVGAAAALPDAVAALRGRRDHHRARHAALPGAGEAMAHRSAVQRVGRHRPGGSRAERAVRRADGMERGAERGRLADRRAGPVAGDGRHPAAQRHPHLPRRAMGPPQPRVARGAGLQAGDGAHRRLAAGGHRLGAGSRRLAAGVALAPVAAGAGDGAGGLEHPRPPAVAARCRRGAGLVRAGL
ncbi:MAG: Chromate transport protein ChrA, partial [uncultured Ramlibacter sp.]